MTGPFSDSDSDGEEEKSTSVFEQRSSSYESESEDLDPDSGSGSDSQEEPQFREVARRIRAEKRKRPADDDERERRRAKLAAEELEDEVAANAEAQGTLADTRNRNRVVIKPAATTVMTLVHLVSPAYTPFPLTPSGLDPGGQSVTCVLGPAAWRSTNSNAQSITSLPCLAQVKTALPAYTFYAGHLLNAQFGGPGTSNNLTALTSAANTAQKAFDNHIVNALGYLQAVYIALNDVGVDVMPLGYGIQLTITVNAARWPVATPHECVSTGLVCTALVVHPPNVDHLVTAVHPTGRGLPALWPATKARILRHIQSVQDEVNTANLSSNINNA